MLLSSMDVDTVLHHMLLVARNYFGVTTCAVMMVDAVRGDLYCRTHNGFEDNAFLERRFRIGIDGVTGHVAATKLPMYVPDVTEEPRYISARIDIRSELALPLVIRDEVLGVLDLESTTPDYFTDEMIGLLSVFAGQAAVALENARLYSTERRRMRQIEFVNLIARSATTAHDIDQLLSTLSDLISDTFEGSEVSILLRDASGQFALRAHAGGDAPADSRFAASARHGIISEALAARMNVAVNNVDAKVTESPGWNRCLPVSQSELGIPLLALGENLGVIVISHSRANAFSSEDRSIAQAAGDVGATAIRNVQLAEELMRLANTDSLTGIYNQRYFHIAVDHEISRTKRFGKSFCVLMFDLKHFKEINQQYGFDSGDEVLRSVAQLMRSSVRAIDTICRYNSDRFAVILPGTAQEQLRSVQGKIESGLDKVPTARGQIRGRLSASFATVYYPQDGTTGLDLIRHLLTRMDSQKDNYSAAGAS